MNENFIYECLSGFQTVLMEIIDAFSDLTTGDDGRESPPPGLSEDTDYPHVYYDYDVYQAKLIERDRERESERENRKQESEENRERDREEEENYLDDEDDEFDML